MLQLRLYLFVIAITMAIVESSHFLRILLVLELITLRLFFVRCLTLGIGMSLCGISFSLVFLTFGVYEAANGLGLLVRRTRASGADQLRALFRLRF